jgi:hypothetical protein
MRSIRWRVGIAAVFTAALAVTGIVSSVGPAMASPVHQASHAAKASGVPQIELNGEYEFQNVADALWLRTPSAGGLVYDSTGATRWVAQNLHNNMYVQLRAVGTNNDCIYATSTGVTAKTCNTGTGADYWYVPTSSEGGNTVWFKPFNFPSDFGTDNAYFGTGNNDFVVATAGAGNYAIWGSVCENC